MIRRSTRILLEVVGSLLAGVAILVALGAWRLTADEPVRLRFLTPYLEEALRAPDGSYAVRIDDTVLTWEGWQRQIDLRATGVRVLDAEGREVAAVPEISLALSFRALMRGTIAPRAITLAGPRLTLERTLDGRFRLGEEAGARPDGRGAADAGGSILPLLLAELGHAAPRGPASYLREISIVDGALTVDDRMGGLVWEAPDADIFLSRIPDGLAAAVDLAVTRLGRPARLSADIIYDRASAGVLVSGEVRDVDAPALGLVDPMLMALTGADLVLEGRFSTQASLDGRLGPTSFELRSGEGQVSLPGQFEAPLAVRSLVLKGEFDPDRGRIALSDSHLALDGVTLDLSAQSREADGGDLVLEARIAADTLSVDDLKRYWPVNAGRNGRRWVVANMHDGAARNATLDVRLRLPGGALEQAQVEEVQGAFDGDGLTVQYLKGLPPIRDGHGRARFDKDTFVANIAGGQSEGVRIASARLVITTLSQPAQDFLIEGTLESSLRDALMLLDRPPLTYAAKLGIDAGKADGAMTTRLRLAFPAAIEDFDEIEIAADATIDDATLAGAILDRDMADGDLTLRVDKQGMTVEGTAQVAGIPSRLAWRENFVEGEERSRISLVATTSQDELRMLGLDLAPFVDGPVGADLTYTTYADARAGLTARLDLTPSTMAFDFLDWRKPAGEPGAATIELRLRDGVVEAMPLLAVEAGGLQAQGRGHSVNGEALAGVALDRLVVGRTDLNDVTITPTGPRIDVTAATGVFDAEPLLRHVRQAQASSRPIPLDGAAVEEDGTPFTVRTANLDRVLLGPERVLNDVRLGLHHDGRYWQEMQLDARLNEEGKRLSLRFLPEDAGTHRLAVVADDAAAVLRLFGVSRGMEGGRLSIHAVSDDTLPERPLRGRAVIYDFRMFRAPLLARLLTIATFTGLVDVLSSGEGFVFDRLIADFTKTGERIDLELMRAYGPTLGITAQGTLDLGADTVAVKGTLIPLFAFNNILANIPLIGDLLTAGEGGGIFAATYRATGPLDEPQISVNPLAALAPGVLRQLFDLGDAAVSRGAPVAEHPGQGGKD